MIRLSLRFRLLGTVLVLIVGLQISTSLVVLERTRAEGEARARSELEAGGRIFARLLRDRERSLRDRMLALAADRRLRRAIATGEPAAVEAVLEDGARRIDADVSAWIDGAGRLRAIVPTDAGQGAESAGFGELLASATRARPASATGLFADRPHQLVLVPVPVAESKDTLGYLGMGFELDVGLAGELRELTGLEITFWSRRTGDETPRLVSTHARTERARLVESLRTAELGAATRAPFLPREGRWITYPIVIDKGPTNEVGVVLQTNHAEAMAPFEAQRAELATFFAAGLALALLAALWLSRRVTEPIDALARTARAISSGNLHADLATSDSSDEIGQLASTFRVMQQAIVERERRILHQSLHDRLTGLPNRQAIDAEVDARIERGDRFAIAIIDVRRLKDVNDSLGSGLGDEILIRTGGRLSSIESVEWVARRGGDEFFAIVSGSNEDEFVIAAQAILEILEAPHEIRGAQVALRFVVGLAVAGLDGDDAETLGRRAEMAIALAKSSPAPIARYVPGLEEANHRRVGILIELERALDQGDLELHYQPKIDVRTARMVGAEALIRWTHRKLGSMNPTEFIGVAEQTGFIGRISNWVLEEAVAQLATWREHGIDLSVSINLSAHDVSEDSLPARIRRALERSGASPASLAIEVTESVVMENPEHAAELLQRVRDLGVGISIDDFGTGHSSLAQLRTLPSDELKIDRTFIRQLRVGTPDEVIVRTTIELAHSLGLRVVAEGVEDRITWEILARHGCDVAQGYWMGRPMAPCEFVEWLDRFEKQGLGGGALAD